MSLRIPAAVLALAAAPSAQSLATEVNGAIDRGVHRLLTLQREDGSFRHYGPESAGFYAGFPTGYSALVTYTLLKSGVPPDDPAVERALRHLKSRPLQKTYSVSAWILALDALRDAAEGERIREAAGWLERNLDPRTGLWGYPGGKPELSNTQYAVLALWTAARHGYETQPETWAEVLQATIGWQNHDGGFGYRPDLRPESSGSMTTAGITTLIVALEELEAAGGSRPLRRRGTSALGRAWSWMDRNFAATGNPAHAHGLLRDRYPVYGAHDFFHYYYLFGLERVAALADRAEIGGMDWYREGALELLAREFPPGDGGGWGTLENTCFALLFLRRATFSGLGRGERLLARSRREPWAYTTRAPAGEWTAPDYDDSGWARGAPGFGHFGAAGAVVRTAWKEPEIWVRYAFEWNPGEGRELRLFALHDDVLTVHLNGVKAAEGKTWSEGEHRELELGAGARAALRRGRNVLAAHCRNTGGPGSLDLRLIDPGGLFERAAEERPPGWPPRPRADAPFLRRWLVLGPIPDRAHELLHASPLPAAELAPEAGDRERGEVWREARALGAELDLVRLLDARTASVSYAFTWLHAVRDTEAVLWVGSDDGCRVHLDGRLVLTHHEHRGLAADAHAVPVSLKAGAHRLLVQVEQVAGASGLVVRLTGLDGRTHPDVRPALAPEPAEPAAVARAHPGLYGLPELLELLPGETKTRLDLRREADLERLSVGPVGVGSARWIDRPGAESPAPHPGGRGLLLLRPPGRELPTRLLYKVRVPPGRTRLAAHVSSAAGPESAGAGARLRLGVFDGELRWLAEDLVDGGQEPHKKGWRVVEAELEPYAGREVLVVVEVAARPDRPGFDGLFLDELELH